MVRFAAGGRSVGLMDVVFREAVGHPHDLVGVHLVRSVLRDHGDGQYVQQSVDVLAASFPVLSGCSFRPSSTGSSGVEDVRDLSGGVVGQQFHRSFRHAMSAGQ